VYVKSMIVNNIFGKGVERSGCCQLFQHMSAGTQENCEKLCLYSQFAGLE
jgi:hypothetical protein